MGSVHGDLCCSLLLEGQECLLALCGHQPLALCVLTRHALSPHKWCDKQVPLAGTWEEESAFLRNAFPKICCSPLVGLSPFPVAVADRNQTPHFCVDSIHQQPAGAGI